MEKILKAVKQAGVDNALTTAAVNHLLSWLEGNFLPHWAIESLNELIEDREWEELDNRFYQNLAFGTGGMRGRTIGTKLTRPENGDFSEASSTARASVGAAYLNDFNIIRATIGLHRYAASYLHHKAEQRPSPKLVIAHDVRHFSRHFCELAASTWSQLGGEVFIFDGPRSTPQLSFTVRHLGATAGIVITASHNPPHDNGYKVYFDDGGQMVPPHSDGITQAFNETRFDELPAFFEKNLKAVTILPRSLDDDYLDVLKNNVISAETLTRYTPKTVFSPLHGVGAVSSVPLMRHFGINVSVVESQAKMDANFSTIQSPNPEYPQAFQLALEKAEQEKADLVMATDPDADRLGVAVRGRDGQFTLLTGNQIGAMLTEFRITQLKQKAWLTHENSSRAVAIKTFVTSQLIDTIAAHHGIKCINTLTGFKWIGAKLKAYEEQLKSAYYKDTNQNLCYDKLTSEQRAALLLKYSTYFIFGAEESYGCLANERVRDKDANGAGIIMSELAATLNYQDTTLPEYLDTLYCRYGYFSETMINLYYEGASGSEKIKNILNAYRQFPPQKIDKYAVTKVTDFGVETVKDADGEIIPRQNFFMVELNNGYRYAVRGSGTEPKIKCYLFAKETVPTPEDLPGVKHEVATNLETIKKAIEADMHQKASC